MRFDALDNREEGAVLDPEYVAQVLQFPKRGEHARRNAAFSAQLLESDRVASIEIPQLKAAREAAWVAFQKATEEMVAATNRMNRAHNNWLDIDIKLFAANAAEKLR